MKTKENMKRILKIIIFQKKWNEKHEKIMKIILFIIMFEFRKHIKHHINSFQKICRFNMKNYKTINEYVEHIQRHYNKIFATNKIINSWILSTCFRMNLSSHLNLYIFQLIHATKTSSIEFIIDDMTTILMKKTKRFDYIEKKNENDQNCKKCTTRKKT